MSFPFSISFNQPLESIVTSDNQQVILKYIMKSILHDKVDNVVMNDENLIYKGSSSYWRGSLFGTVDKGVFSLNYKDNKWRLNYQINIHKLFLHTAILSSFMEIFVLANSGPWWIGLVAFSWLCGVNGIITFFRHQALATEIAWDIDELICGKIQVPEQDKMTGKLKSWY